MKLWWGWACVLLLSLLALSVSQAEAQDDLDLEMEDEMEEAMVEDTVEDREDSAEIEGEAEMEGEKGTDANVSFQVTYKTPVPTGEVYFSETFDDGTLDRWQVSKTMKEDADDEIAKYDGKWSVEQLKENKVPGDMGLVLKSRAKHHAIASLLDRPFIFRDDALVVQYEVNFQDGIDCGGAYIKLLSDEHGLDLEQFNDRTSYTIMFGPDKCGEDYKLHFIFRHRSPLNKDLEEKHAKRADVDLKKFYTDKKTHLYTLVLNPDNSYEILVDQSSVSRGSLLHDVVPPVNPTKEIDDPTDSKPEDWDERAKIPDPEAVKPDNWDEEAPAKIQDPDAVKPEGWLDDEPEFVADPAADKPDDWDEEMDGEWEAPQVPNPVCETAPGCGQWKPPTINNPQYKGKWKAPLVDNPHYQGVWSPRKIQNPDYFEDLSPFQMRSFRAVGLELWSMTSEIYFDNFIITSYKEVADRWAGDSWGLKKLVASANEPGVFSQLTMAAEERPWLWVVYILTVGLPVGLTVLFCWPKKSDDDYVYKKVDPPKPDVEEEDEDEDEEDDGHHETRERSYTYAPNGDGTEKEHLIPVAIKVLHPGIRRQVEIDMLLMRAGSWLINCLPGFKWLSLPEIVEEFEVLMTKQIDLRFEANNIERFRENFKDVDFVKFPTPLRPFVTRSILVETFEESEPISNYLRPEVPLKVKQRIARMGVETLLKMVFVDNFVHADLHPGNILVQRSGGGGDNDPQERVTLTDLCDTVVVSMRPAPAPLQLVLLDAGIVAQLNDRDRRNFRAVFTAVVRRQGEQVAELILNHARTNECQDVPRFKKEMAELVDHALSNTLSLGKVQVTDLLSRVFGLLITHKVKLESNFASIVFAIMVLEGLGRSLDPNLDILELAKPLLLKNAASLL